MSLVLDLFSSVRDVFVVSFDLECTRRLCSCCCWIDVTIVLLFLLFLLSEIFVEIVVAIGFGGIDNGAFGILFTKDIFVTPRYSVC